MPIPYGKICTALFSNYSELARLATKGEVDPLSQIGRIVKKTAPYLLLVIRDLLPLLERDEITYYEVIYNVIRAAQQFPDQQVLIDSRSEMQEIEEEGRVFLYAVKWLDAQINLRPAPHELQTMQNKLNDLNDKYKQRYAPSEEQTTTLIPCFFVQNEADPPETNLARMADLVRRAVLEMHHLMIEYEPARRFIIFNRNSRKEMEEELMQLVWFLFRCGYAVDRIASGYYKDLLAEFLNEKILEHLIDSQDTVDTLQGLSSHLWLISLVDFAKYFELPNDYIEMDDYREVARFAKFLKSKNRRGATLLKRMLELLKLYESHPQGRMVQNFLLYRYNSAFGAYHGENRQSDPRGDQAVKLYKGRLDREAMEKKAEQDLKETGSGYSTKTRDEMSGIIKLIVDSLADPGKVKGRKLKVLGDISSGAMGKVSIGIFENRIVALKRVKSQVSSTLGDPICTPTIRSRDARPSSDAGSTPFRRGIFWC